MNVRGAQGGLTVILAGMLLMAPLLRIWPFSALSDYVLFWLALVLAPLLLFYGVYTRLQIQRVQQRQQQVLLQELDRCHEAEQDLIRRQVFYQTILDDLPEMVCRWQPDGHIIYVNDAYCRYFDISREDAMRQGELAQFRPSANGVDERALALYREQPVVTVEFPVLQPDGTQHWQRWLDKALFDEQGRLCEFQSIGEDITMRKHAEQETAELLEEKKRLARMALAIQEQERAHLARELHDELGQSLTAIRAEAQCVIQLNRDRSAMVTECASSIEKVACQVYQVVNGMMHRLRPALLDDLGLIEALNELIRGWGNRHPEINLQVSLETLPSLDKELELTLFRAVQEALTNVANHARADELAISLSVEAQRLVLTIRDNGVGFANSSRKHGFGLLGMRERCLAVAGELSLNSQPGAGTTLCAVLPILREQANANRDN